MLRVALEEFVETGNLTIKEVVFDRELVSEEFEVLGREIPEEDEPETDDNKRALLDFLGFRLVLYGFGVFSECVLRSDFIEVFVISFDLIVFCWKKN